MLFITIISSVFARKSTYNVILAFIFISGFDCLICLSYHKRFVGIELGLGRDDGQGKGKHADAMKTRQSRADRAHVNMYMIRYLSTTEIVKRF